MTIGAAVLHAALGLPRPRNLTHLSFACIMVMLTAYLFFSCELYRSMTIDTAVETVRYQVVAGHGLIAFILVFVRTYTCIRIPRWLAGIYGGVLAAVFVMNLVEPYGIWFASEPHLFVSTIGN